MNPPVNVPIWVSGLVTTTSWGPAVPAGVITVIDVEFTKVTPVASTPPIVTVAPVIKPVPVIVTGVPPALGPEEGEMLATVGTGKDGTPITIGMDLIAAFTQPNYSLVRQSISSLALTSMGWIQTIGFMLIGLMVESFTAGLYLNIKRRRGFGFGTALLAFFGFGMLVLGTFHTRAVGAPATFSSRVHAVAADCVLGLFPIALALMLTSIKNDRRWKRMFSYTVITGVIAVALAACYPFLPKGFQFFGLYERLMVLNSIIWLGTFAVRLLFLSFQLHEVM